MPISLATPSDYSTLSGKELERLAFNIHPGGWSVAVDRPISTLLGSCVAVCLYDPKLKIGGMNHFLLPHREKTDDLDADTILSGAYSMEVLVNALFNRGGQKGRLVAKIFGGGTIVSAIRMAIGERNVAFAKEWLQREGIPVVASDVLGPWSRKVIFVASTGDVFCRRNPISQDVATRVVKEEQAYEQSLVKPRSGPQVELF
ncbi:putative chemoreceptor glutamine deamidase CheD 1 [Azospira sp. I13]|uniref:chemotaxis protein CheD n=1 Tax=Azospira sp. I13 TaxID=1765050 RepID=UPI000D467D54|nr:chemotaxis protein CheD [Azospira sp. I13]GBG03510.1 putative chemoreceptor glutamine deamidase CheD 1 [Azospira sp. I13]